MTAQRVVAPEWLDTLPADDPRALRSRNDLRRINRLMAAATPLGGSLTRMLDGTTQPRLVELGAGDGSLALRLARRLSGRWPSATLALLDLQPAVNEATVAGIRALGWQVEVIGVDALEWLAQAQADHPHESNGEGARPVLFANLFVHHFDGARLQALLAGIARRARGFACLEPRRSRAALFGSRLLGAMGCNDVTRHDAVVSVRAGFDARELSGHWPAPRGWSLREGKAGLFGHRFEAVRTST